MKELKKIDLTALNQITTLHHYSFSAYLVPKALPIASFSQGMADTL
jgi:hypothetical protein